jgi:hypothetical protein
MPLPHTIIALFLTTALAGCGGQYDVDTTVRTATAAMATGAPAPGAPPVKSETVPAAATIASTTIASATMPAPDCAAEGCASLRIIDGNAEAWRIDAQRRAALEAGLPRT